ncbi:MAG: TIGR04141 family sporadically distributed protein [Candidatus Sulfotelmatobacter sp.]
MSAVAAPNALTIFFARPELPQEDLIPLSSSMTEYPLVIHEETQAKLYVQRSHDKTPDWTKLFAGYVDPSVFGKNRSTGAVLLVKRTAGYFALTFGTGRFLINSDNFEDRFGLKVTLNCIGENTVRSIEKHSLDALLRHTHEQSSRDATPREFGFDIEQDLLRAVTGKPIDPSFGQRMSGADSLHIALPLHLLELPELLDRLHEKFIDTSYQTKFPWIDQIAEVRDPDLEAQLDNLLTSSLVRGLLVASGWPYPKSSRGLTSGAFVSQRASIVPNTKTSI